MQTTIRGVFVTFCLFFSLSAISQVQVGTYPYGTFDSKGFDTINVGNLNVHFGLPIVSKPGRGLPFSYMLGYDSSVWSPYNAGAGSTWTPTQSYGWLGDTATMTGYTSYNTTEDNTYYPDIGGEFVDCTNYNYSGFTYVDPYGQSHTFMGSTNDRSNCHDYNDPSFTSPANDSSGYTITVTSYTNVVINGPNGLVIVPTILGTGGAGSLIDTNGNEISTDGSGTFTDTLGSSVLVIGGGVPSNETFTYKDATGTNRTVTLAYASYTVQTAFGCSGIGEFGPTTQYLVHTVTYPDGSQYMFDYESTPGASTHVTGRIAQVTLPTGGRISYSYSGGSSGINCSNGGAAVLTRTLNDDPAGSTWTYTTSTPNGAGTSHTEVLDGNSNHIAYDFVIPSGIPYETLRKVYQTVESGTPNVEKATCYNSSSQPCTTTVISAAISQVDTYNTLDGSAEDGTRQIRNSSGFITEQDDYDFGTSTRGSLLNKTSTSYSSLSQPTDVITYDGSGNALSHAVYAYDGNSLTSTSGLPQHISASSTRGNLTSISLNTIEGSSSITAAQFWYDDAGQVRTRKDAKLNTTTYAYDSGTDALLTGVTMPTTGTIAHTTSSTYNTASGAKLTDVDQNGNTTTYTYDTMLRPSSVSYPGGGYVSYAYSLGPSSPYISTSRLHVTGGSNITSKTYLDPYERAKEIDGTDTSRDDLIDYAYDADGNVSSTSNPYRSGDTVHYATATYDSLSRPKTVTDSDGASQAQYTYAGNAVTTTDEAGKQRKVISDGLGRIKQVWEPDAGSSLTLETDYLYNQNFSVGSGSSVTTYQSVLYQKGGSTSSSDWRTRTFTYDMLGRMLTSATPEAGTTAYTYPAGSGSCAGILTMACTRADANSTASTYSYDALNRPTAKTYGGSSIGTGTTSVAYSYDQASYNGLTISNGIGLRTGMSDGSGATAWSFDGTGHILAVRKTINSVTKQANYTFNADGTVNTMQDFGGTTFTYSYNAAGRSTSIVDGSNTYASSAVYNAAGQLTSLSHQLTSGGGAYVRSLQYNNRLQPAVISATLGGSTIQSLSYGYGTGGTNNGNILSVANDMDSNRNQTYTYDNLNRLASGRDATHWGETYTYDNWGNLYQTSQISGLAGNNWSVTPSANNRLSNLTYDSAGQVTVDQLANTYSYDAEGRLLTAGGGIYVYDGDGYRVKKTASSTVTLYWPGAGGLLDESNSTGSTMGKQVQFAGLLVWHEDTSGAGNFLFHDHLGSIRVTGSASGSLADDNDYWSYGKLTNFGSSPSDNQYAFTGDESDASESSTDYATFRNLGTTLGRFNRPDPHAGSYDPTNPQSFNRYSYVLNNPLNWIDVFGLVPCAVGLQFYGDFSCDVVVGIFDGSAAAGGGGGNGGSRNGLADQAVATDVGGGGTGGVAGGVIGALAPPSPPSAPSKQNLFTCASEFASKYSIAGGLQALGIGTSGVGGFITNALGGNVFSGATDLIQSFGSGEAGGHSVLYNMGQGVAAGPTQGFGAPFSKAIDGTPFAAGPADVATSAILRSGYAVATADYTAPGVFAATFASEEALQFATGVGEVKLGVDAGIYALGLAKCAAGK